MVDCGKGAKLDQVNIVSLNSVALALANEAQWQRAMTLLQPWWPFATAITFNTLALACKDASQWQQTLAVLDFAQRRHCTDGRSKSTLLSALAKVARWEEAFCFALSNTMDDVALSAAINACEKGWQWRPALHLLHSLEHDHVPAHNSAISACEKAQQWQMALLLLSDHPDPSVVSFNAALSAVTGNMAGQLSGAMKLVSEMMLRRISPDLVTYTTLVAAASTASNSKLALKVLDDMRHNSVQPQTLAYNAALHACNITSAWQEALETFAAGWLADESDTVSMQALLEAILGAGEFRTFRKLVPFIEKRCFHWLMAPIRQASKRPKSAGSISPDPMALDIMAYRLLHMEHWTYGSHPWSPTLLWRRRHQVPLMKALKSSDATLRDVAFGFGKAGVVLLEELNFSAEGPPWSNEALLSTFRALGQAEEEDDWFGSSPMAQQLVCSLEVSLRQNDLRIVEDSSLVFASKPTARSYGALRKKNPRKGRRWSWKQQNQQEA